MSRLGRQAFEAFALQIFEDEYPTMFVPYKQSPLTMYLRNLGYNEYIPVQGGSEGWQYYEGIYIFDYLPLEVFKEPTSVTICTPDLVRALSIIKQDYDRRSRPNAEYEIHLLEAIYFVTNFSGLSIDDQKAYLSPQYRKLLEKSCLKQQSFGVGNIETFCSLHPEKTLDKFREFVAKHDDGICIELSEETRDISHFSNDKYLLTGVSRASKNLYEPVYIKKYKKDQEILHEFKRLILKNPKEAEIESFIRAHHTEIFGSKYDRIETQLWLKFPELDIGGKERRLDIFLRNCVSNDWELYEVKRPIKLTASYRDCPILAAEVHKAIQQIRNYAKILSQDVVKKTFAKEGIEYYEPLLHLVIGRKPQISNAQWRAILGANKEDVKLITYDDLLEEMKIRIQERFSIITTS